MGKVLDFITGGNIGAVARAAGQNGYLPDVVESAPRFSVSIDPGVLYGVQTLDQALTPSYFKVPRRVALRVGAVKQARDLIAGQIGTLPLQLIDSRGNVGTPPLLRQPEPDTAASVTWTRVAEDLLFDGHAWLLVTATDYTGRPSSVRRLDPDSVTVQPVTETTAYGTFTRWPDTPGLVRIDSPHAPLLVSAADAIMTCLSLSKATNNAAQGLPPITYFSPTEGVDPVGDDEVQDLLDAWTTARSTNATAYVPAALRLNTVGYNPDEIALDALRDQAVKEIARHAGLSADKLGVSVTTRTYANVQDARKDLINESLNPFLQAVEDRLSMNDVTLGGYRVTYDLSDFLRADDTARMSIAVQGLDKGVLRADEARTYFGGLTGSAPTPPAAAVAAPAQEVPAP